MKNVQDSFKKGIAMGMGVAIGLLGTSLIAVAISTFNDGEVLTAAKLNANLNALKTAVEAIHTVPQFEIQDANGTKIADITTIGYINSKGYSVLINNYLDTQTGIYGSYTKYPIYYTSSNCTGTPYSTVTNKRKMVFYGNDNNVYYSAENSVVVYVTFNSFLNYNLVCATISSSNYLFPIIPNDPSVTGFNPSSYVFPLKTVAL